MKNFYKEYFHIAKGEKIRDKVMLSKMVSSVVVTLLCLFGISITAYAYFYHNISSGLNIMSSAHFEVEVSVSAQIPETPDVESNAEESEQTSENSEGTESTESADMEEPQDDFLTEGSENAATGEAKAQNEGETQTPTESEEQSETEGGENPEENQEAPTEQTSEESLTQASEEKSSEITLPHEAYAPQIKRDQNTYKYTVHLYPGVEYKITISHGGSAKTSYCLVRAAGCGTTYITRQIGADIPLSFSITVNSEATIEIVPNWGTARLYDDYIKGIQNDSYILDGDTVNILLPITEKSSAEAQESGNAKTDENSDKENIYTVKDGDSIYLISETYGVSMDRITAYNELSDPNIIHTGDIIKIPPADWVMPETSKTETGSTDDSTEEAPDNSTSDEGKAEGNTEADLSDESSGAEGEISSESTKAPSESESSAGAEATDKSSDTESEKENSAKSEEAENGTADESKPEAEAEEATVEGTADEGESEADTETDVSEESTDTEGKVEASDGNSEAERESESDTQAENSAKGDTSDTLLEEESNAAEKTEPSQIE